MVAGDTPVDRDIDGPIAVAARVYADAIPVDRAVGAGRHIDAGTRRGVEREDPGVVTAGGSDVAVGRNVEYAAAVVARVDAGIGAGQRAMRLDGDAAWRDRPSRRVALRYDLEASNIGFQISGRGPVRKGHLAIARDGQRDRVARVHLEGCRRYGHRQAFGGAPVLSIISASVKGPPVHSTVGPVAEQLGVRTHRAHSRSTRQRGSPSTAAIAGALRGHPYAPPWRHLPGWHRLCSSTLDFPSAWFPASLRAATCVHGGALGSGCDGLVTDGLRNKAPVRPYEPWAPTLAAGAPAHAPSPFPPADLPHATMGPT